MNGRKEKKNRFYFCLNLKTMKRILIKCRAKSGEKNPSFIIVRVLIEITFLLCNGKYLAISSSHTDFIFLFFLVFIFFFAFYWFACMTFPCLLSFSFCLSFSRTFVDGIKFFIIQIDEMEPDSISLPNGLVYEANDTKQRKVE